MPSDFNKTNCKILIVDDQQVNVTLLENFLTLRGFTNLRSLTDSREVINTVDEFVPDLILLDVMMPHISGIEILRMLNEKNLLGGAMQVLVLTADSTKETMKEVLSSGADDLLRKPFDFVELELRINKLLQASYFIKKMQQNTVELNSMVELRTAELKQKNDELQQFVYVASHDLQEPLRMITGFLNQLEKKYAAQLDETAHKYIRFAVDGATRMKNLILEILDYSRADQITRNDLTLVDLNQVLEDVQILLRTQIEENSAKIQADPLPNALASVAPMRQIFLNLIGNSLKYRKKDIAPFIQITCEQTDAEHIIHFADNGIGIDPKYQDKIFDLFMRLHNREEYSGTGMGLTISKKMIEQLGGKLTVQSELDKGSVFSIHIPK